MISGGWSINRIGADWYDIRNTRTWHQRNNESRHSSQTRHNSVLLFLFYSLRLLTTSFSQRKIALWIQTRRNFILITAPCQADSLLLPIGAQHIDPDEFIQIISVSLQLERSRGHSHSSIGCTPDFVTSRPSKCWQIFNDCQNLLWFLKIRNISRNYE